MLIEQEFMEMYTGISGDVETRMAIFESGGETGFKTWRPSWKR